MALPSLSGLDSLSDETLGTMVAAFERHQFDGRTEAAIARFAPLIMPAARTPVLRWHLERRREPAFRLALLFSYMGSLPRREIESLIGAKPAGALIDAGLLVPVETGYMFSLRLEPFLDLWILADGVLTEPESVMPPGPTTEQLASILPERIEGRFLEAACGPGGLALLAARRGAARALGADLNPRAVALAHFNARLNRLDAEFRTGDLLSPVAGEQFDLVVAQPPFLFRPPRVPNVLFLHGGERGDAITLRLLRELHGVLAARGEALVRSDVSLLEQEELVSYVERQLGSSALQLLVLHASGPDPDVQGMSYASAQCTGVGRQYLELAREYITHAESLGIAQVRQALFVARRAEDDASWLADCPVRELSAATPAARQRLWTAAEVARDEDAVLATRRIRVAPDAEWVSRRPEPEGEQSEHRVRFGESWPALEQIVTDEGLVLASILQQSRNLEEAIRGYAERCDATPDEVRAPVIEYIRAGLKSGMLVSENDDGH